MTRRAAGSPSARRVVAVVAGLVLLATGCGDPVEDYCSAVEGHRKELADMVSSDAGSVALLQHLPMLRDLAEQSPPDLKDDWQTFLNAVENLDRALTRAEVDPSKFAGGKPPPGTDPEDVKAIQGAADQLTMPDVAESAGQIEGQARDVCKVNFGL